MTSIRRRFCQGVAALALAWTATIPLTALAQDKAAEPARSRAESGATKPCIECHEGFYAVTRTKHGIKGDPNTPKAQGKSITGDPADDMCSSCHGDLSAHNKTPRVKGLVPVTFGKKAAVEPQNEACLTCHQGGTRIHWQGSKHERTQQTCASCHRVHAAQDPVMVAETQASVCFDCHKDRRAEMHRLSTHPTKTGFISCSSCHASHGSSSQRASLQKDSVNETCYTCHAHFRGPFLWEHRPSSDDCTNCHNPHGTNNVPMLKARAPFLCQQCHQNAIITHSSNVFSAAQLQGAQLTSAAGESQRLVGQACYNCHVKVHGSNHPSGARLQR
jgi:DmsE family decaheme c-type cytochrome